MTSAGNKSQQIDEAFNRHNARIDICGRGVGEELKVDIGLQMIWLSTLLLRSNARHKDVLRTPPSHRSFAESSRELSACCA